ncbi:helix-turn-helix domain-containing protein [Brucella sp. HL-2]|nr:helix-turn-helix domain-containing protein [Brucella sp. HL-2]MCV9910480.1 helix-turn-helix domain-containing protein [Brucella sp. HL-2]
MEALFTPATLAKRWECSEKHVRNLIKTGQLDAFRLGGKLYRIKQSAVEAFEAKATVDALPTPEADKKPIERLDPLKRLELANLRRMVKKL